MFGSDSNIGMTKACGKRLPHCRSVSLAANKWQNIAVMTHGNEGQHGGNDLADASETGATTVV